MTANTVLDLGPWALVVLLSTKSLAADAGWGRGGALSREQRSWLTAAFETLGPTRVRRGLEARGRGCGGFLALAIAGGPDAPTDQAVRDWASARLVFTAHLAVAPWIVDEIARAWDRREGAFRELAREWLELGTAAYGLYGRTAIVERK